MTQIELVWAGQKRFLGIDSTGHSAVLSSPGDIGVKPSDALLISLAACVAYDVVEIIQKQRLSLARLGIAVEAEQAATAPWAYQRIHLRVSAAAPGLGPDQFTRAVDLSLNKYCSVRASLHPDIQVSFEAVVEE